MFVRTRWKGIDTATFADKGKADFCAAEIELIGVD